MNVLGPISDPSEMKKWLRSVEGVAALKGIPGTAQGFDLLEAVIFGGDDKGSGSGIKKPTVKKAS